MLIGFQIFGNFSYFCIDFLLYLYSENNLYMIQILLNLLKLVSWTRIWTLLVNISCALEKNNIFSCCWVKCSVKVNYINVVDGVVQVLRILNWFLSTCFINYWWSSNMIVDLSPSPCSSINQFLLHHFKIQLLDA